MLGGLCARRDRPANRKMRESFPLGRTWCLKRSRSYDLVMRVLAGDLAPLEGYTVGRDVLRFVFKTYSLVGANIETVSGGEKDDPTRPAHAATGAGIGMLFAGPVGALVGGAVGFAGATGPQPGMVFHLTFADGRRSTFHGTMKEYAQTEAAIRRANETESSADNRLPPSLADRDRIRADFARAKAAAQQESEDAQLASREAKRIRGASDEEHRAEVSALTGFRKLSAEEKLERKARKKAVTAQGLPMREAMRLLNEIDADYR